MHSMHIHLKNLYIHVHHNSDWSGNAIIDIVPALCARDAGMNERIRRVRRKARERRAIMRAVRHEHRFGARGLLKRRVVSGWIEIGGPGWGASIPGAWYGLRADDGT
jgi:hypothetical protein